LKASDPLVVISSKAGRLGNRLFLSAYFMANSLAKGYNLINPALDEYAHLFEGSFGDPYCAFPHRLGSEEEDLAGQCRSVLIKAGDFLGTLADLIPVPGIRVIDIRRSHDEGDRIYDLGGEDFDGHLHSRGLLVVKGWKFRDNENLLRFHGQITSYFTPVQTIRISVEEIIRSARAVGDFVIGVHIRQGDYRGWKNGVHFFETDQYAHWMRQAAALHSTKKPVFLICASDTVEKHLFEGLDVIDGPGTVVGDLHALSLCDAIMGPPSTFSAWASYRGRVPLCMLQHHQQRVVSSAFVMHDRV